MWVLDCLDDVCSDLSAFHHVADASELEGAVFFRLAMRLPFYDGAVAARLAREIRRMQDGGPAQEYTEPEPGRQLPPATGASLEELNRKIGKRWFSYTQVPRVRPEGGD
jgi:hypothetical protein